MNNQKHAIVIGGSIAGLCTAQVLSKHFDKVTILERDSYPSEPATRSGVPQSRHVHVLLTGGALALEKLFPGFNKELIAAGITSFDWIADSKLRFFGEWLPRKRSGLVGYSVSRRWLEHYLRQKLIANPKIDLVEGIRVKQLLTENGKVKGIETSKGIPLLANWVVDASGRDSQAPTWLETLGYAKPEKTVVNSRLGYASCRYTPPANTSFDWQVVHRNTCPPHDARAGVIFTEEDGNWVVTLAGAKGDYPPTDEKGFKGFIRSLGPEFYKLLEGAKPLTNISGYRKTANRQWHYERLNVWPDGFIVTGDSVCAFNPVYGQGMSACALAALELDKILTSAKGNYVGKAKLFQKRLAKVIAPIWLLATGEDFRWLEGQAKRIPSVRFSHWYISQLGKAMPTSAYLTKSFIEVTQLAKPLPALFHPAVIARIIGHKFKKKVSSKTFQSDVSFPADAS